MSGTRQKATYVTPQTPRQAVLNALSEIEANEITNVEKQADIIIYHLRDYDGGKFMVWMARKLRIEDMMKLMFQLDAEQDEDTARNKAA